MRNIVGNKKQSAMNEKQSAINGWEHDRDPGCGETAEKNEKGATD